MQNRLSFIALCFLLFASHFVQYDVAYCCVYCTVWPNKFFIVFGANCNSKDNSFKKTTEKQANLHSRNGFLLQIVDNTERCHGKQHICKTKGRQVIKKERKRDVSL